LTNANSSGNISRKRHPKKEVEAALVEIEALGVRIDVVERGHVWARMYCPCGARPHQQSVDSSPKSPGNEAHRLKEFPKRWARDHERAKEQQRRRAKDD